MLLSVIIVSYNTAELTLQTLESVVKDMQSTSLLKNQSEIWVVDNNSSDDSISHIKKFRSDTKIPLHILENKDNQGFASANNQAIEKSTAEYVLLLNSDTIVKPGALEHLVTKFQTDKTEHLGIVAASLRNPDGSSQPQGGSFPTFPALTNHMLLLDDLPLIGKHLPSTQHTGRNGRNPESKKLYYQDWVGGTAMMIKRSVLEEVGPLDQEIFMYGEDLELCMRAADHQWLSAIDPQAEIIHYGSASSSSANAIIGEMKAYRYIWSKHKPLWQIPLARVILKAGCLLRILIFGTISPNSQKVSAYQAALGQV